MSEHNHGQDRLASSRRFGLAENVGGAVKDYYDLLFDSVNEFIGMNHEEILEYERENAELAAKLAGGGLDQSGEKAIRDTMRRNTERVGEIREFLNSDRAIPLGLDFSEDVLNDSEPELADRFNAAPIAEKYSYLVNRYMDEYRDGLEGRADPQRNDSLAEIDAFRFGTDKVREYFPKVAEQHEERMREEYKELLASDPVRLHGDLTAKYSMEYVAGAERRLLELQHDLDVLQSGLREHDAAKPGWLRNLATLGAAGKEWAGAREMLARELAGCDSEIAKRQQLREECREAWLSESAREHAKGVIASRHPEIVEACERHMARHWEKQNEARLERQKERQAERDDGNGQSRDEGLSL